MRTEKRLRVFCSTLQCFRAEFSTVRQQALPLPLVAVIRAQLPLQKDAAVWPSLLQHLLAEPLQFILRRNLEFIQFGLELSDCKVDIFGRR